MVVKENFISWLLDQSYRDDPVGDLCADLERTGENPSSKEELEEIMKNYGASDIALDTLERAWEEYKEKL